MPEPSRPTCRKHHVLGPHPTPDHATAATGLRRSPRPKPEAEKVREGRAERVLGLQAPQADYPHQRERATLAHKGAPTLRFKPLPSMHVRA